MPKRSLALHVSLLAVTVLAGCYGLTDEVGTNPNGNDGGGGNGTYPGPPKCSNGQGLTSSVHRADMAPGEACIACHTGQSKATDPATTFWVAGTVFPSGRESSDCKGVGAGVTVTITDADGKKYDLTPNAAGNFALPKVVDQFPIAAATFKYPYTAVVKTAAGERAMGGAQTDGDCNACHGEPPSGGAPGRIVVPGWNP